MFVSNIHVGNIVRKTYYFTHHIKCKGTRVVAQIHAKLQAKVVCEVHLQSNAVSKSNNEAAMCLTQW